MVIVPAMASSGSKPSGATESSVSGATEPSGSSAMELSSPAGLPWSVIFTHTHNQDLRAQYAAENKQKLEVVSVPARHLVPANHLELLSPTSLRTSEN